MPSAQQQQHTKVKRPVCSSNNLQVLASQLDPDEQNQRQSCSQLSTVQQNPDPVFAHTPSSPSMTQHTPSFDSLPPAHLSDLAHAAHQLLNLAQVQYRQYITPAHCTTTNST
jgi:hypothetical protein